MSATETQHGTRLILDNDKRDFIVFRPGSGHTVEIFDIQVGSERRKGKGRRLVYEMLDRYIGPDVRSVFAITRVENEVAQQFWTEMRFLVVNPLRRFYRDSDVGMVDALMFVRELGEFK